jgi:type VI secretion system secreted protein VgrG
VPGGALAEVAGPGGAAQDDRATARHDDAIGAARARRQLEAQRGGKYSLSFTTNVLDLSPGVVFSIDAHPHLDLPASRRLLLLSFTIDGSPTEEWAMSGEAVFADVPHRPPRRTPRPTARLQTAVVVGPRGQEIHTDEHGRVRVQFPWDREGKLDDASTPWIRTSQGWAGKGYGMIQLPRIGQEVLVDFLDGDPEQPVIVGRVFNMQVPVPYRTPDFKTRSGVKSDSSLGSNGYNEIYFEDMKGEELMNLQAQKYLRHLVKNDETITVGHHREKKVGVNEHELTGADRIEVTGVDRSETTGKDRFTVIGGNRQMIVGTDETERTFMDHRLCVSGDQDIVVGGVRREAVREDDHLIIDGEHREKVGGHRSTQVEDDQYERVDGRYAKYARQEMHLKAGSVLVLESGFDLTFRGPAGFVRIGPAGITIKGTLVKINSGGDPGSGKGAQPLEPDPPAGEQDEEAGK